MKILFAFENLLPSSEADAEVFVTTAKYLAPLCCQSWLHVPTASEETAAAIGAQAGVSVVRATAPSRPGALRHLFCGVSLVLRREFRSADLVYTRNLWIAWLAVLFGQRVVFDHYRPWPDQIPPLQFLIYRLLCHPRFLLNISHSDYTSSVYAALGIPAAKLVCIHNGFEPERFHSPPALDAAKRQIGIDPQCRTVVYTGRINHKKGLELVIEAARMRPEVLFLLVGSYGQGPIEALARGIANVRIVPWQSAEQIGQYIFAADVLLIPPSLKPLATFGSTVLPLKLFAYMASGRPVIAGDTPDVRELLQHERNAWLCRPDCLDSLIAGIDTLLADAALRLRLATAARADSDGYTWPQRAGRIAGIVSERLQAPEPGRGRWGRPQFRAWRRQSWRWLAHLLREGSWVLPPDTRLAAE